MHAEDFIADQSSNGHTVEAIAECLPQLDVVSLLTLLIEPVYSIDRGALVVPSQKKEVFRIFNFVGQQKTYRLDIVFAPINIVAQKEVV